MSLVATAWTAYKPLEISIVFLGFYFQLASLLKFLFNTEFPHDFEWEVGRGSSYSSNRGLLPKGLQMTLHYVLHLSQSSPLRFRVPPAVTETNKNSTSGAASALL
jgi:hypothetical protein